jgi:hypothetical protein
MPKPEIIQVVDVLQMGAGAAVEVRVNKERVVLIVYMPGQQPRRYTFNGEQAKRIGDALMTGAARLEVKLV